MHQIYLTKLCLDIAAVSRLLQQYIRVEIFRFQMIRIVSFIGYHRVGGYDRILWISLIRSPYVFGTPHRHTMVIACTTLGTHNIIITVPFGKMRCFDAATVCASTPDALRIADDLLFLRIILGKCDHARLLIALSCLPVQRNNIFSAVIIVKDRCIKAGGLRWINRYTCQGSCAQS